MYYGLERRDTEYCNHIVILNLHPPVVVANDPRHYIALHFGLGWELQFVRFFKASVLFVLGELGDQDDPGRRVLLLRHDDERIRWCYAEKQQ